MPVDVFEQSHPVVSLAFSKDGDRLVARFGDGRTRAWRVAAGGSASDAADEITWNDDATSEIARRLPHPGGISAAAFSLDGAMAITGGQDNTARLWDMKTGEAIGLPLQHRGVVNAVAFGPDGRTVLTGSLDRTARLWHVATGEPASPSLRHAGRVIAVAASPDGRTVVTSSWDKTARFWSVVSPVEASVDDVAQWVETMTGMTLDASEAAQILDADSWKERRDRLRPPTGPHISRRLP